MSLKETIALIIGVSLSCFLSANDEKNAYEAVKRNVDAAVTVDEYYDFPSYMQWKVMKFSDGGNLIFSANRRFAIKGEFVVLDMWLDKEVDLNDLYKNIDFFPITELYGEESLQFSQIVMGSGDKHAYILGEAFTPTFSRIINQISDDLFDSHTIHVVPMKKSSTSAENGFDEANIFRIGCSKDKNLVLKALKDNDPSLLVKVKLEKQCKDQMLQSQLNILTIISSYQMPYLPFVWRAWDSSGMAVSDGLVEYLKTEDRVFD